MFAYYKTRSFLNANGCKAYSQKECFLKLFYLTQSHAISNSDISFCVLSLLSIHVYACLELFAKELKIEQIYTHTEKTKRKGFSWEEVFNVTLGLTDFPVLVKYFKISFCFCKQRFRLLFLLIFKQRNSSEHDSNLQCLNMLTLT